MNLELQEEGEFRFYESKGGKTNILLLHGLLGQLSNFSGIMEKFSDTHNIIFPLLPIFEMPLRKVSVSGLVDHIIRLVEEYDYKDLHIVGNSLGGHIAILFAMAQSERVASVTLTGSSGLFESAMGTSFPRRGDYEYMKAKVEDTFYDPKTASKDLVDDIFETVNDRNMAIRIIATAKSAVRHNLGEKLHLIKAPTLLIWGNQDKVTPPFVGEKFNELIENSELHFIDKCGHAPMMEKPEEFNQIFSKFLARVS